MDHIRSDREIAEAILKEEIRPTQHGVFGTYSIRKALQLCDMNPLIVERWRKYKGISWTALGPGKSEQLCREVFAAFEKALLPEEVIDVEATEVKTVKPRWLLFDPLSKWRP